MKQDKDTTILVTGGLGFIGSNFIRYMLEKYPKYRIINLDKMTYCGNMNSLLDVQKNPNYTFVRGDICEYHLVNDLMGKVSHVVNFAAESHVDRSFSSATVFTMSNVYGAHTIFETARVNNVKKVVHIGTDEVYGSLSDKEAAKNEQSELKPTQPYSSSKAAADLMGLAYYQTYNLPISITRSSNNYGPYQYPEKLVPTVITNAIKKKPIPLHGDGSYKREWLHVLDNCRGIDLVLHNGENGEIYNIGGNKELSNIHIVKKILDRLDRPESLIKPVPNRKFQDNRYALNTKKIQKLGWKVQEDFEKGLAHTVDWYKENEWWWKDLLYQYPPPK